jgi:outer membrane autotransporter protein
LIQVGFTSDRADGDFEGDIFGAYAELTRGFELPGAAEIAPLASVAYTHLMWGDFDEGGVSPLRMEVDDQEIDSVVTSVGFRIAAEREMDGGLLFRPRFKVLWNHEWGDTEREVSGGFASNPTTGVGSFTVEGAEVPSDYAELSVGWEVGYAARANLFLEWDGRFAADLIENSVSVGARVAW